MTTTNATGSPEHEPRRPPDARLVPPITTNATDAVERETVNMPAVFKMLGISRPVGYELAKRDALPVPVIRLGRNRMVVSKRALDDLLNARKPNDDSAE